MKNQINIKKNALGVRGLPGIELTVSGGPSWERPGTSKSGFARLEVERHVGRKGLDHSDSIGGAGWVQIRLSEFGDKSSRTTFITIDRAQAAALAALLALPEVK